MVFDGELRKGVCILVAGLSLCLMGLDQARAEGAALLAGAWKGGGIVEYITGNRERARCQARYSAGATTVSLNATCATPSGSIAQYARLHKTGANTFAGTFFNSQYSTSGSIRVVVHGDTQTVSISSGNGSASLVLKR